MVAMNAISRDNARTPMQWTAGKNAGFTDGEPWMRVNRDHTEINAAAQDLDPDSVMNFYRALIRLRHEDPVIAHGDFEMLFPPADEQLFAYRRTDGGSPALRHCESQFHTRRLARSPPDARRRPGAPQS